MGLARLALAGLAVGALLVLLFVGGRALLDSLDTGEAAPEPPSSTPATSIPVPTLHIECVADVCPLVTVRVPGGDVLQHREMTKGEEVSYFEPELDVVLTDSGSVRVTENGHLRPQGETGEREAFTVPDPGE